MISTLSQVAISFPSGILPMGRKTRKGDRQAPCLLCNREDLNLDTQYPCKSWVWSCVLLTPALEGVETDMSQGWAGQPLQPNSQAPG